MAIHSTSSYNVKYSINDNFDAYINAYAFPTGDWFRAFGTSGRAIYNMADIDFTVPVFSVTHIGVGSTDRYQGRGSIGTEKAAFRQGIMDVQCWTSMEGNFDYQAELDFMVSVVEDWYLSRRTIVISDYVADYTDPTAVQAKVDLVDFNEVETAPDPNPDLRRTRILISYQWNSRSST